MNKKDSSMLDTNIWMGHVGTPHILGHGMRLPFRPREFSENALKYPNSPANLLTITTGKNIMNNQQRIGLVVMS